MEGSRGPNWPQDTPWGAGETPPHLWPPPGPSPPSAGFSAEIPAPPAADSEPQPSSFKKGGPSPRRGALSPFPLTPDWCQWLQRLGLAVCPQRTPRHKSGNYLGWEQEGSQLGPLKTWKNCLSLLFNPWSSPPPQPPPYPPSSSPSPPSRQEIPQPLPTAPWGTPPSSSWFQPTSLSAPRKESQRPGVFGQGSGHVHPPQPQTPICL